ncbi:hypothetical protein E6P09_12505 [Haloferax mediterranei ATCC 33500]|uniref:DUF211 domain-containing protein n=1 Tax=Haloferax mediterranei (strain ATCC 33500 / DSM 1411 / JCM 8866 / NBRC 14739 / NCIMB 2177 / R-4) TaxID=523841 RepID=I3R8G5_HALMT|nr:DUF211 domain-containing protein [Haloferax mediterranei]AFK20525.1 hypothetical protein HFX_2855 [Haloferax mediterranei ATCC 33500]AHZ23883.1 hypothetical protein BM92_15070 [Haloferax mediterranei ATCC 33500]ELZ98307.1 hypothetical protein C439_16020 [Haloferax mediterranei ATCC 33500]MDX5986720.1 DUF211 domain-containing protein [Haloferax mediterranei ATCC 33500]QCQ76044.1 hypothetical protein E6P09_12505 [Haloferax mediterranei ATCC 33500]
MAPIRRLVLDVLKPHSPSTVEFAREVAASTGVAGVNTTLLETDREVQNLRIIAEGEDIDVDEVERRIGDLGGTVHSIDEVVAGERLVEYRDQPQDWSPS